MDGISRGAGNMLIPSVARSVNGREGNAAVNDFEEGLVGLVNVAHGAARNGFGEPDNSVGVDDGPALDRRGMYRGGGQKSERAPD